MAVPKKRTSVSRKKMRRSHLALDKNSYVIDKTNGQIHRPHHVDFSGSYKGKQVIELKSAEEE